jgi:hypothetical protein
MKNIEKTINKEKFLNNFFDELSKLPFGSLPKTELELIILHSIIESQGGYDNLNAISRNLQRELKISQTKFKNKVLEAQLRFDTNSIDVEVYLRKTIVENDISILIFDDKFLMLYISNPLLLNDIKTYFDSKQIINDTSFNKNLVKIEKRGLLKILINVLEKKQLEKLEKKIREDEKLKNTNFSLVNNLYIDSIFSASIDPFESIGKFIEFIRKQLS